MSVSFLANGEGAQGNRVHSLGGMAMDRLTSMEVLVRVVETGSFSGAARLLRVGQPAVSKTIAQLEERLGVRLLLRSSRGVTPTEAGQKFYERAKRAIEEADEAELAARRRRRSCGPVALQLWASRSA